MEFIELFPRFGGVVWTVVAFVVALSIIVAVHEYGHYIVGRWSGIHAEVFSLGFGPVLYSRVDRRGTRWQIAALPFGGYVKFLGDANAASGKDATAIGRLSKEEQRHTMYGAPLWARAATVAAGPAFNFAMAFVVFTGFFLVGGVATDAPTVGALRALPNPTAGLEQGDVIVALEGTETPDFTAFMAATETLAPAPAATYTVRRGEATLDVEGPFPMPPLVGSVYPQSAAADAGMAAGDVILAIDGVPVNAFRELPPIVEAGAGKPVRLTVWRADETLEITLSPRRSDLPASGGGFETRWLIGLSGDLAFEPALRQPGPLESVGLGASQTWEATRLTLSGIWHVVTGAISTCNLRGPIGIAETSGAAASAGLDTFIWFIAALSVAVGLMNLLPVPVLDGGHLVFHAWEAVTGKPPTDRALRVMMTAGFMAIMSLMIFAITNDIFCP